MADRIVVMRNGTIAQAGTPLEVYDRPDNLCVLRFIGSPSMNTFEGTCVEGRFRSGSPNTLLPGNLAILEGREISLGVRPDKVEFVDQGTPARVVVTEPTGSETVVVAEVGNEPLTVVVHDRLIVRSGNTVQIRIHPEAVHVFDTLTGAPLSSAS